MTLVKQKVGDKVYLVLRESFWDSKRRRFSSRNIQNFGRLDILEKENPNIIQDLKAKLQDERAKRQHAKQQVWKKRIEEIGLNQKDMFKDNQVLNLGVVIYKKLWDKLELSRKIRQLTGSESKLDLAKYCFFMVAGRNLIPSSKLYQWQHRQSFVFNYQDINLFQLYRFLDKLILQKDPLLEYLNKRISKFYDRSLSVAFYDVTTYYFESQKSDDLKDFGFSKDNKINQVQVVMGLLIDQDGIPIHYELFKGNISEFKTLVPILQVLKERYKIKRVIITADRGLNSKENLAAIKQLGMEYLMSYKLKSAPEHIKALINNRPKSLVASETQAVCYEQQAVTLKHSILIYYSAKRAIKDRRDRERLLDKARFLVDHPGYFKSSLKRGGKNYLSIDKDFQIALDEKKILEDSEFDGYYGIVYSDPKLAPNEVIDIYHSLWQIEESFRITKHFLKARPCFHWKDRRVKAHFLICYLALFLQRMLEKELKDAKINYSTDQIYQTLREASVTKIELNEETLYAKAGTQDSFQTIGRVFGIKPLPTITTEQELKSVLKVVRL